MKDDGYFEKGDFIVLIKNPIDSNRLPFSISELNGDSFKLNNVYKQRSKENYLAPALDSKGSKANGWSCYSFKHNNWRYATSSEIEWYKQHGNKPYNVDDAVNINNFSII